MVLLVFIGFFRTLHNGLGEKPVPKPPLVQGVGTAPPPWLLLPPLPSLPPLPLLLPIPACAEPHCKAALRGVPGAAAEARRGLCGFPLKTILGQ